MYDQPGHRPDDGESRSASAIDGHPLPLDGDEPRVDHRRPSGRFVSRLRTRVGRSRAAVGATALAEGPVRRALLRRDARFRRALAAVDVAAGAAALLVAGAVGGNASDAVPALVTLPVLTLIAQVAGLYHRDEHLLHKTTLEEVPVLFQAVTLYSLLTWLTAELTVHGRLHEREVLVIWPLLLVLMVVGRSAVRSAMRRATAPERCLVLGDAAMAAILRRKFEISFSLNAVVVGRMQLLDEKPRLEDVSLSAVPVLGTLEQLAETIIEHDVHRVIVAPTDSEDSLEAIRIVKAVGVKLSLVPRMLEVVGSSFEFDDVDGVTLLGIRRAQLSRSSRLLKRGVDLGLACAALIALAPVIGVIAAAIKLTSAGPVLYRQKRIGRGEREFYMLKFRSMVDGADAQKAALLDRNETEGLFKIADDPRVTSVGRILRKSSLDELPQLWNVVRGEMSLVGPRPLVPDDDAKIEGWQRKRLNVTPGMTGVWQILGSTRVPLNEMVKLDYLYAATWSLWLDFKILVRTIAYVANRRSA
jgi:exopolysaccharide biosynthesis polyprenyl glycosylphosphotransferase